MMTFQPMNFSGSRLDASVELGQRIADQWGTHALMIQMSRDICKEWRTRNRQDEAQAIHSWIKRRVKYIPDPINAEMIADPLTTIKNGGDCDDQAVLAAALLQAIGHDARIAAVTWEGREHASHAVALDLTAGCVVDTVGNEPGAWPPAPYKVKCLKFKDKQGQMQTMNGFFSKVFKAVAKPFQKIFPAKTLLGKIVDPLGLTDPKRNLNLAGRVADVVGTAATLAVGAYAVGAAGGAAGGFWSTAGAGAKMTGAAALKAGAKVAGWAGTAAKTVAPLLLAGGGQRAPQEMAPGITPEQAAAWSQYAPGSADYATAAPAGYATGGGGGGGAYTMPDEMPGATVEVTDTANRSSLTLPILAAAAVAGIYLATRKKKGA